MGDALSVSEMAGLIGSINIEALYKLGFEEDTSGERRFPGSPAKLKVTQETVEKIKSLVGKSLTVADSGEIELEAD